MSTIRPRYRLPVIALLLLAPWTAECSWGGFTAAEFPFVIAILAPMYGGAAVLIREVARRTGGGWPAIVLLASAFGLVQAGLVDQSLLNPQFLDDTQFRDMVAASAVVPGIGISLEQLLDYVGNHVALSICAPIAIIESFVGPQRRQRPWLGAPGLVVTAVVYVLGSLLIHADTAASDPFLPSGLQLAVVVGSVLALIAVAFAVRSRPRAVRPGQPGVRSAPSPLWVAVLVVGAHLGSWLGTGWPIVSIRLAIVVAVAAMVVSWSRRPGWGQRHVLAAWGAGLVVAAATAYLIPTYAPASPQEALLSDIAISVVTATLLVTATLRLRRATVDGQPAS